MADVKYTWRGDEVEAKILEAAARQIYRCALDLAGESARRAPIDTGDLRSNVSLSSPLEGNTPTRRTVRVGYDLPYARRQHEELTYRHPKGGGPKYLENPAKERGGKYRRDIARAVDRALEG